MTRRGVWASPPAGLSEEDLAKASPPYGDRRSRHRRDAHPLGTGERSPESLPVPGRAEDPLRQVVMPAALASLSPVHREILHETVLRGRSVNDAAEALGMGVETVKVRVYHALRALRAALEERGVTA
ncbi:sigma factor-like helix-turn-helix DNA-binding protein [Streptosporangium sp. NPDC023615]|uniref:sigma factor-like helix-turn-helix DNA-binding protein n=1 Tax=Streptosporangium sp. NPDC023615 TaxID=3154794 RepID=UPI0034398AE8